MNVDGVFVILVPHAELFEDCRVTCPLAKNHAQPAFEVTDRGVAIERVRAVVQLNGSR